MDDYDSDSARRNRSMKNWVAWKWRWAMEAWKAKTLSHRIQELETSYGSSSKPLKNHDNKGENNGIRTLDNFNGAKTSVKMDSNSSTVWSDQFDQNSDEGKGALTKVEEMQKQVEKLSTCLNKMMPTLSCVTNKTGDTKRPTYDFNGSRKCKTLSMMKSPNMKQIVKQGDNNSITIDICPTRNLGLEKRKQPKVQRKASWEDFNKPKPGVEPNSTTKCLQTLQVCICFLSIGSIL